VQACLEGVLGQAKHLRDLIDREPDDLLQNKPHAEVVDEVGDRTLRAPLGLAEAACASGDWSSASSAHRMRPRQPNCWARVTLPRAPTLARFVANHGSISA